LTEAPAASTPDRQVVFTADRPYFRFAAVAIESLCESTSCAASTSVHLISPDLTPNAGQAFAEIAGRYGVSFHGHAMDQVEAWRLDWLTPHFYRLLVPQFLPSAVRRYLYLDSDLMIMDDLSELFDFDLTGAPVAAAIDYLPTIDQGVSNHRDHGLPAGDPYFNSGVLLVDRQQWVEMGVARVVVDITRQNADHLDALGKFHQYEQYGFNVALHGRIRVLERRWNYGSELPFASDAAIVHFNGHGKPWSPTCTREYQQRFQAVEGRLAPIMKALSK
jgi:lipopolysaccharide biosynthesis glycosyltransferase